MPKRPPTAPPRTPTPRGEEVLDTLEDIVLAEGFRHLNVATIAARLACSKRTLYALADSRDALLLRVLDRFFARIREDAQLALARTREPREQVYAYLQVGVRAAERLSQAAVRDIQTWPPACAMWQEHVAQRVGGLRGIIEEGVASGAFHGIQPAFVAEIVFAAINRVRQPDFYQSTDLSLSEAFDELYRLLLAAITPPEDAARQRDTRPRPRSSAQRAQH
ncbi:MAG: TetR/AcrR family transcriptional regulator [Gammaproteobacteria bacterium]